MISHHLKEDAADIQVKERLWQATERELLGFSERYAAAHEVGERVSDPQEDIACAAKLKGYPKTLVRNLGGVIRRELPDETRGLLDGYRQKLGLASGRKRKGK